MSEENKKPTYELRENGEIHFNKDGHSTLLAKYDHERGRLTFENFNYDQKYRFEVVAAVSQDPFTGRLTGRTVRSYAIAGRPLDKRQANEPPQPMKDTRFGDKTEAFVRWLARWRPQAFYARYGVFLDSNGDPTKAHCIRVEQGLLKPPGNKPLEIGDRAQEALGQTVIEKEDGILAMRATCLTFLKEEQVGYTQSTDAGEEDMEPMIEDDGEAGTVVGTQAKTDKPKRGRVGAAADPDDEA